MGTLNESAKIQKSLVKLIKKVVAAETRPCFRVYKAVVTAAPANNLCKVKLIGDQTEIELPYSSKMSSMAVGDVVLVATVFNSLSNAIVWETYNFS